MKGRPRPLAFTNADGVLSVKFPRPLPAGREAEIAIEYAATPRRGLYFRGPDADYPDRRVRIEGFTDSTGSDSYNQQLSESRAFAVRNALEQAGIDSSRIEVRGYGETNPVATNDTSEGRQLNRRVEVLISDEQGAIASR